MIIILRYIRDACCTRRGTFVTLSNTALLNEIATLNHSDKRIDCGTTKLQPPPQVYFPCNDSVLMSIKPLRVAT